MQILHPLTDLRIVIPRQLESTLRTRLSASAAVVPLGPRQVGETTMAKGIAREWPEGSVYLDLDLDLDRPSDRRRLDDADSFLREPAPKPVLLDAVHRMPAVLEITRGVIDDNREAGFRFGQFLLDVPQRFVAVSVGRKSTPHGAEPYSPRDGTVVAGPTTLTNMLNAGLLTR